MKTISFQRRQSLHGSRPLMHRNAKSVKPSYIYLFRSRPSLLRALQDRLIVVVAGADALPAVSEAMTSIVFSPSTP